MGSDLSQRDLRGRSFARATLLSANLAGSDVRGADFTGAALSDADCSRIRCGMSRGWTFFVAIGALALSVALGLVAGWAGRVVHALIVSNEPARRLTGVFVSVVMLAFLVVGVWRGLRAATFTVLPVAIAVVVIVGLIAIISGLGKGTGALMVLAFLLLAAAVVALAVLARAAAGTTSQVAFVVVAIGGGLIGGATGGGLTALAIAIGAMLMARRSASKETLFPTVARLCAAIACYRGTRFRNADLRGTTFDGAALIACDFRGAHLERARIDRGATRLCRFD